MALIGELGDRRELEKKAKAEGRLPLAVADAEVAGAALWQRADI